MVETVPLPTDESLKSKGRCRKMNLDGAEATFVAAS
jgi:hypothetical protein